MTRFKKNTLVIPWWAMDQSIKRFNMLLFDQSRKRQYNANCFYLNDKPLKMSIIIYWKWASVRNQQKKWHFILSNDNRDICTPTMFSDVIPNVTFGIICNKWNLNMTVHVFLSTIYALDIYNLFKHYSFVRASMVWTPQVDHV